MADPKATRFKAMSWDEQVTFLEQSAQEVLKAREERIAYEGAEAVESPLISQRKAKISIWYRMHEKGDCSCWNRHNGCLINYKMTQTYHK